MIILNVCFASSQLQAETKKFSTEDRTNKFKQLRQEKFCFLLLHARNETSLRGDKAKFYNTKELRRKLKRQYFVIDLNVAQLKFAQTRHIVCRAKF